MVRTHVRNLRAFGFGSAIALLTSLPGLAQQQKVGDLPEAKPVERPEDRYHSARELFLALQAVI